MGLPFGRDNSENPLILRFKSYFQKFANVLGADRVILTDFSKTALHRNDIRLVLKKIGFPEGHESEIKLSGGPTNESLSAEAIAIAVEMAKSAPDLAQNNGFFRRYNAVLSSIRGSPIRLSEDEENLIMTASRPHLEYLRKTFGIKLQEPEENLSDEIQLFDKSTIESLARQLRLLIDRNAEEATTAR